MSFKAPLKPNPFSTYRDPATGRWEIIKPASASTFTTPPIDSVLSMAIAPAKPCYA